MNETYISLTGNYIYQGVMQEGDRVATPVEIDMFRRGILGLTPKDYEDFVQKDVLDATAHERGYDDIYTCIGYVGDPDPTFNDEAVAARDWRSVVWRTAQGILNEVFSGQRPAPTFEELKDMLPKIEWPSGTPANQK